MYCKKCGNEISNGAKFCRNCGTPTGNTDLKENNKLPGRKKKFWIPIVIVVCLVIGGFGINGIINIKSLPSSRTEAEFISPRPGESPRDIYRQDTGERVDTTNLEYLAELSKSSPSAYVETDSTSGYPSTDTYAPEIHYDITDPYYVEEGDCYAYDLGDKRAYGWSGRNNDGTTMDFEGYMGIRLSTDGSDINYTIYNHALYARDFDVTLDLRKMKDGKESVVNNIGVFSIDDATPRSLDTSKLSDGMYFINMDIDDEENNCNGTVRATFLKMGSDVYTARLAIDEKIINNIEYMKKLTAGVNPSEQLDVDIITYPTAGLAGSVVHTDKWIAKADELISGEHRKDWSDEMKIFAFTNYLANNIAFDRYKANTLGHSRALEECNKKGDKGVGFRNDYNYAYYNGVGVCWDYANIMAIMCRHIGVPAITIDTKKHTVVAVYLDGRWLAIDVTMINTYYCDNEDVSRDKWKLEQARTWGRWYGYYDGGMITVNDNLWTEKRALGNH